MGRVMLLIVGALAVGPILGAAPSYAEAIAATDAALYRWQGLIAEASRRFGVPEAWIRAVMQAESGGRTTLDAGAIGLMQVIPPTGEWVALQLGIRDFRAEDLARPSLNVRFGTWYLGRQMRDFSGDPLAALAAYNGGPGNARLWLSRMAEYDPDLFVESIPFAETQTYVKTILEQYAVYRALYQPGRLTAP